MSRFFNLISGSHAQCFLPGITRNYRMQLGEWKKKVKKFILEKLSKFLFSQSPASPVDISLPW